MEPISVAFIRKLNNRIKTSTKHKCPLFTPEEQIHQNERDFPEAKLSLKNGCHVTFEDGSQARWNSEWKRWEMIDRTSADTPFLGVPNTSKMETLLNTIKSHENVSDAFVLEAKLGLVTIAIVTKDEKCLTDVFMSLDPALIPFNTRLFARLYIDSGQWFMCTGEGES